MKLLRLLVLSLLLAALMPEVPRSWSHEGHDHNFLRKPGDPTKVIISQEGQSEIGLKTESAHRGDLSITLKPLLGRIEAAEDKNFDVNAPISGVVKEVRVVQGDTVKSGDTLAIVRSTELANVVAKLLDERAKVQAEKALAKIRLERDIKVEEVELALVQSKYERQAKLGPLGAASKESVEVALTDFNKAKATLEALKNQLQQEMAIQDARLTQVTNAARSQTRVMGLSDIDFDEAISTNSVIAEVPIRAPTTGVVTFRDLTPGESFDTRKKIFTVLDPNVVWVVLEVFQEQLPLIEVGQHVTVDTAMKTKFSGVVSQVAAVTNPSSRTIPLRIVVDNPQWQLRPGMFASGEITVKTLKEVIRVPESALIEEGAKAVVFVKRNTFMFQATEVAVGAKSNGLVEIKSGVKEHDDIAVGAAALQLYGNSLLNRLPPAGAPHEESDRNWDSTVLLTGVGMGLGASAAAILAFFLSRRTRKG
jgi:multidrug efflux pump subunit AcrA (membrane-fusion protein)